MPNIREFYEEKYLCNEIPWHRPMVNKHLVTYWPDLCPVFNVFFPLCGKTLDMVWVYEAGHNVVGVEMCEKPVRDFFNENHIQYIYSDMGNYKLYKTYDKKLTIYIEDIFQFYKCYTGLFDIIVDRASLSIIDPNMRVTYINGLRNCLQNKGHIYFEIYQLPIVKYVEYWNGLPHHISDEDFNDLMKICKFKCKKKASATFETPVKHYDRMDLMLVVAEKDDSSRFS